MGPYCNYCNLRCFTRLPDETPDYILKAYQGTATIIATCPEGQRFERETVGYCYDDIKRLIEASKVSLFEEDADDPDAWEGNYL